MGTAHTDLAYDRLDVPALPLGPSETAPLLRRQALASWADRLAAEWAPGEDAYVYLNNDPRACALRDAIVFARVARRAGLRPTRVPGSREVTLS